MSNSRVLARVHGTGDILVYSFRLLSHWRFVVYPIIQTWLVIALPIEVIHSHRTMALSIHCPSDCRGTIFLEIWIWGLARNSSLSISNWMCLFEFQVLLTARERVTPLWLFDDRIAISLLRYRTRLPLVVHDGLASSVAITSGTSNRLTSRLCLCLHERWWVNVWSRALKKASPSDSTGLRPFILMIIRASFTWLRFDVSKSTKAYRSIVRDSSYRTFLFETSSSSIGAKKVCYPLQMLIHSSAFWQVQ